MRKVLILLIVIFLVGCNYQSSELDTLINQSVGKKNFTYKSEVIIADGEASVISVGYVDGDRMLIDIQTVTPDETLSYKVYSEDKTYLINGEDVFVSDSPLQSFNLDILLNKKIFLGAKKVENKYEVDPSLFFVYVSLNMILGATEIENQVPDDLSNVTILYTFDGYLKSIEVNNKNTKYTLTFYDYDNTVVTKIGE